MNIFRKIKQMRCTHYYTKISEGETAKSHTRVVKYRCELCGKEITCFEPARRKEDLYGTRRK